MLSLKGKVAIVTGAGSVGPGWGNGKATAVLLARQGAKVFGLDNNAAAVEETISIIKSEGGEATAHICDVLDSESFQAAVEACVAHYGQLDIMVNLKSAFLGCKFALPHLKKRPGSAIVNISSIAGYRMQAARPHVAYSATKYGIVALSKSVAIENAKAGVRCNTVVPGLMHTPLVEHRLVRQLGGNDAAALIAKRDAQVPLGKMGDGWDIAHAVLFLVSNEARHITGTELIVDGGVTAAGAL
jgi:NAD(P)-dependent dehydrogenase (short-subunit alcohol dehydrogenase family)